MRVSCFPETLGELPWYLKWSLLPICPSSIHPLIHLSVHSFIHHPSIHPIKNFREKLETYISLWEDSVGICKAIDRTCQHQAGPGERRSWLATTAPFSPPGTVRPALVIISLEFVAGFWVGFSHYYCYSYLESLAQVKGQKLPLFKAKLTLPGI